MSQSTGIRPQAKTQDSIEKPEMLETLLRDIWFLTSDFPIREEEVEDRKRVWNQILGNEFFGDHGRYVPYLIKRIVQFRTWRGPIHADEFYRMFVKVILEKQVWSFKQREWIEESEAMEIILNSQPELADQYRKAEEIREKGTIASILHRCRAIIYGWEE